MEATAIFLQRASEIIRGKGFSISIKDTKIPYEFTGRKL